jgi:2-polyprenyl-6-methoxyphenol hydroxylase-like FAD-dependent oxidoreductase
MRRIVETDLLIVGGGPAGAAAAIAARSYALRVVLERDATARMRPGEAAHHGIEPLLTRLGVMDESQTSLCSLVGAAWEGVS